MAPRPSRCSRTARSENDAPVNLVTGPGNIYVAAAKRHLQGIVSIDAEAGPTEIAIIADDTADPAFVAADLISQAEHDPMAAAVLITDCERWPTPSTPSSSARWPRPVTRSASAPRSPASSRRPCWCATSTRRVDVANAYAAEHLEIQTADAAAVADRIVNAGADLRRLVHAGLAGRLRGRLQPRAAHGRVRLPLLGPVGARVLQEHARRDVLRAPRCARSATTSSRSPRPRTCRRTARPSASGVSASVRRLDRARPERGCPSPRRAAATRSRTVPRRSTCRSAQHEREPLRPERRGGGRHRRRGAAGRAELNRYPDREAIGAARGAGRLPRATG